jgi:hypothetical protein
MSNSLRKQITDAVVTALSASSNIAHVTTKREPWWDWDMTYFPGVCVVAQQEEKSRFAYIHPTAEDMHSSFTLEIEGYTWDNANDNATKQTDLIRTIETTIQGSTAVDDLTWDIYPTRVETDQGLIDNYSVAKCEYKVRYIYNHATP